MDAESERSGVEAICQCRQSITLTDYEGYNPEVDYKGDNLLPGFDWGVYPLARTYSIGAKITF